MKYCPYCGTDLIDSETAFCTECGRELPSQKRRETKAESQSGEKQLGSKKAFHIEKKCKENVPVLEEDLKLQLEADETVEHVGDTKSKPELESRRKYMGRSKQQPEAVREPVIKANINPIDDYDGYYDDILPTDLKEITEGIDKELIKKIALLMGAVLLIVCLCIIMMYVL